MTAASGGFLAGLGGLLAPDPSGDPAAYKRNVQLNALLNLGLGTLAGAQQPGARFGGALASGFQQAQQSLAGAQQQAFQAKQEKRREEREERLLSAEIERGKLAETERANKAREQSASVAQRFSTGLGKNKGRELEYFNVIKNAPEFKAAATEYGIDPSLITTPEQVLELGQQFGALGGIGAEAPAKPNVQVRAIVGPDGKPLLVNEEDSIGKQPYTPPPASTNINNNVGQPTVDERKDAALATRLQLAMRDLSDVETQTPGASQPSVLEKGAGLLGETAANAVRDPQRRRANAAQLDALDAALTLATGAAYTKEQLEALRTSYFPQIGDDAATRADKQARFEAIVNVAKIRAGRAAPLIDQALPQRGAPAQQGGGRSPLKQNADGSYTYTPLVP